MGLARHAKQYTTERASVLPPRRTAEAPTVLLAGDDSQHYLAEPFDRLSPGLSIGVGDPRPLRLRQLPLEFSPLRRQLEETLAPIVGSRPLDNELLSNQLTKNTAQALLCYAQNTKQLADAYLRVASNKMDDAVMGAAKTVFCEDGVRFSSKVTIREKQEFDTLAHYLLMPRM